MTSSSPARGLSPRDRKLLLAFAFFVEAVVLYMLMIDPLITRLGRARDLEATSRRAYEELSAVINPSRPGALNTPPDAALAPLPLEAGESPSLAIQRALGEMASAAGVQLGQATIEPEAEMHGDLLTQAVRVEVSGPYDAVAAFIRDLDSREPVRGIDDFSIATAEQNLEAIRAKLTLRFFLPKP